MAAICGAAAAAGQGTLSLSGGQPRPVAEPPVTTASFAWLEGTWEGRLANSAGTLEIVFTAPKAGFITGVMRLVDQEKILVVELISMVDTPTGPELRFRHFSSTLEAYETEFRQAMRLVSHAGDRDVFENAVLYDAKLMSTQGRKATFIRRGADEYVAHSDIIDSQGKPAVIEAPYCQAGESELRCLCQGRPRNRRAPHTSYLDHGGGSR